MNFLPEHTKRLALLVNRPGGLTANEAVAAAEEELEKLQDRGLTEMAEAIAGMQEAVDAVTPDTEEQARQLLYNSANFLLGVGAVFGRSGVGVIAQSLCTLMEELTLKSRWDLQAVQLHVDSLRLAYREGNDPKAIEPVYKALKEVVVRVKGAR